MNLEQFRNHCLAKPGVTEGLPFDENTLVFKVMNKVFAITDLQNFEYVNLKCDPEIAIELREQFESVRPGYHMNKKHWNSVYADSDASDQQMLKWTDNSYELIVKALPKKVKEELASL